jgi:FKBP-type peptidyl-prolyl cis-trans isomerase
MNAGRSMKDSLKTQSVDVDQAILLKGLDDGIRDAKPQMTEDEMKTVLEGLQKKMMAKQQEQAAKQQEQAKAVAEKNKKEGEAFLAANKKKEGVITMPSGLQYKVLTAGKGKSPKATDTVTVHYRGTLIDGTEFDSSYKRGQPATFPLNQGIKGWTEAVQLMKEGAHIPSDLGSPERGREHRRQCHADLRSSFCRSSNRHADARMQHGSPALFMGSSGLCVGSFYSFYRFFAYLACSLNESF